MNIEHCVEEVQLALDELTEINMSVSIIVEGVKDRQALRKLGLTGKINTINKGLSLADFSDWIAERYEQVIILTDWDRRGGLLCRRLKDLLKGRVKYDVELRQRFSRYAMIKTVEGLPSWLETMTEKLNHL